MNTVRSAPVVSQGLLRELQDLKRLRPAHLSHSIATEQFLCGWRGLLAGQEPSDLAMESTLGCLLSVLFPGVDGRFYRAARLDRAAAGEVMQRALLRTAGARVSAGLLERLIEGIPGYLDGMFTSARSLNEVPDAIKTLCRQPRAGATHPEYPRLVLEPPEMHSDHCLLTAVYAVLYADSYGADYGLAWLAGMAHHLHNAYLPDCGYAGEICLGSHLGPVIENCRTAALEQLPTGLRGRIREALRYHETIAEPEGRAISAGDVIDRVLDVQWRTRAAAVTDADVLGDLDLVHPGPLKNFQTALLAETGIWTA